jgi:hypothetical protein
MPKEEQFKKSKRKKIKVRVSRAEKAFQGKSSPTPFEIDLSSAAEEKFLPPLPAAALTKEEPKIQLSKKAAIQKPGRREAQPPKLQLNLYRKIAFSFIFLTLALLAVIFYFSFVKVVIILTPAEEKISDNLIVDVYDKNKQGEIAPQGRGAISGVVEQIEVEETKIYESSGADVVGEEVTGKVTIVNNYNKNQPLVATTRLLSADGKLFRIKSTVSAPAGGTVEVEVYADQPSADMAIGPAEFTIPGLWAGLQDKIYAESKEPMQYQRKAKKYIQLSDIDSGIVDLRKVIISKAADVVGGRYKDYSQKLYKIDDNSIITEYDGEVGDEKDTFSITIKAKVAAVAFPDNTIFGLAEGKLVSSLSNGKVSVELDKGKINYNLDSVNLEQGAATVNIFFEGKTVLKDGSSIIDKEKILGLNRQQLNDYLANLPGILNYEVKFSPSFIDKVPNLADRIEVKIKN